jgi:N4-gp56 family major capsid protein
MLKFIDISFFDVARMTASNTRTKIEDYYDRVALTKALPLLTFRKFGQKRPLPKNQGKIIRFTRWGRLTAATTPITEGITPLGNQLSYSDITATIQQYGDFVLITDHVSLTAIDPILTEAVSQLGYQQGETFDILSRDEIMTGSNAIYANGIGRTAVNTKISDADINKAVRALKVAMAKPVMKQVNASVKYNTTPIKPSFIGVCHVYAEQDIEAINGFVPVEKYSAQQDIMEGEFGSFAGVRFIATTQAPEFLGGGASGGSSVKETDGKADIYATIIFGEDAYGEVPLSGQSSAVIIKAPTAGDRSNTADPLNQRSTAGWSAMYAFKILNDLWIERIEHAVSA